MLYTLRQGEEAHNLGRRLVEELPVCYVHSFLVNGMCVWSRRHRSSERRFAVTRDRSGTSTRLLLLLLLEAVTISIAGFGAPQRLWHRWSSPCPGPWATHGVDVPVDAVDVKPLAPATATVWAASSHAAVLELMAAIARSTKPFFATQV